MELTLKPRGEAERCPWCHEHLGSEPSSVPVDGPSAVDAPVEPAPPVEAEPVDALAIPVGPVAAAPVEATVVDPPVDAFATIGGPVEASAAPVVDAPPSGAVTRCEGCGTAAHAECVAENGGCSIQGCSKQAAGKPREKLSIHVEPRPPARRSGRRVVGYLLLGIIAAPCLLLSALQVVTSGEPAVFPRLRQQLWSPDGRDQVQVWTRLAWPPWGGFDPAIVCFVDHRASDGALHQRVTLDFEEATDLGEVRVDWARARIFIAGDFGLRRYRELPLYGRAPAPPAAAPSTGLTTSNGLPARLRADGAGHEVLDRGEWVPHHPAHHGVIDR